MNKKTIVFSCLFIINQCIGMDEEKLYTNIPSEQHNLVKSTLVSMYKKKHPRWVSQLRYKPYPSYTKIN